MRISAAFPSQYLKSADLNGRRVRVSMSHVAIEEVGNEPKPILYFASKSKGLVLNKTNANTISMIYGDDTDNWAGQVIELFEAQVEYQGRMVAAIRVHIPRVAAQAPAPAVVASPPPIAVQHNGAILDDEIPF